jgi:hypothetical protein
MKSDLVWGALSLLVAGAAATPLLAHPGEHQQKHKIIIMTEGDDGDAMGEAHAEAREHGSRVMVAECGGDKTEFSGSSDAKREKARVVICNRGNVSAADRARRLEHVLARINADDELSAETKAKISTALRDAIGRLNTAH